VGTVIDEAALARRREMMERVVAAALALALAALAAMLVRRAMDPRPAPPATPDAPAVEAPTWVVPPGREDAVMALLRPALDGGVAGRSVVGVQIEGEAVRASLEGGGALVVTARGALSPALEVAFVEVDEDAALRARIARGDARSVFVAVGAAPRPSSGEPEAAAASIGILTPAVRATGWPPWLVVALALGLGAFVALAGSRAVPPSHAPRPIVRPSRLVIAATALAVGLRVWLAVDAPLETDEVRPLVSGLPLLSSSHDAWLHPPLYRALMLDWIALTGWTEGDPAIVLRLPSLIASCVAAVAVVAATHRAAPRLAPLGAVAVLVGPALVSASVLARPYALVAALAGAVVWAMATGRVTRARAAIAVCAAGLACWADVLGGAMLGAAALSWLARGRPRSSVTLLAAILALGLFASPVAVGAIEAARSPAAAQGVTEEVVAAQRPERGMGRGWVPSLVAEVASCSLLGVVSTWLGIAAALAIGLALVRGFEPRPDLVLAVGLAIALAVLAGSLRSVRPRNLLVLPMLLAPLLSVALARGRAASPR